MKQYGGLAAVSRMVTPESYFARQAAQHNGYRFVAATEAMSITTSKPLADQWDTAVRTRYPQLHKRPEFVMLLSTTQAVFFLLPYILLIYGLSNNKWALSLICVVVALLLALTYGNVVALTYRRWLWRGMLLAPLAVLLDMYIRHYSLWCYEFKEVTWKGRDVTAPVMHVVPQLPVLDQPSRR